MKYIFFEWLNEAESRERIEILNTSSEDINEILVSNGPFEQCFPEYMDEETLGFVKEATDWNSSLKAVVNGRIIGFYLLGHKGVNKLKDTIESEKAQLEKGESIKRYSSLTGIEGVALGVIPEYRKRSDFNVARELKNRLREMKGLDYIYGMQYKSLNNLQNWVGPKKRRLFAQSFEPSSTNPVYITLEDLPQNN